MKKNIMRKSLAVLVAFCMLLSMFPAASFAASFNDISSSHWAWQYVNDVVDRGLFQGTGSGTFEPETNMSRAMFVVALNNFDGLLDSGTDQNTDEGSDADDTADDQTADDQTAGDADTNGDDGDEAEAPAPAPSTPSGSASFSDVPAGQWYSNAVAWASSNEIVSGFEDNTFGPNSNITREQMASLIVRYASYAGISLERSRSAESFSDSSSISSYASSAVTQCYQAGLINGMGDGTFAPQATATRAQVAVIISKLAALSRGESIIDEEDAESFTVRFDSNGGSSVESQTVKKGEKVEKPKNPTKTNFSFGGWYTDEELKSSYNFNTAVTSSFTLYAKWVTPGSGGGGSGGNGGGGTTYSVNFNFDAGVESITYLISNTSSKVVVTQNGSVTVPNNAALDFTIQYKEGYELKEITGAVKTDEGYRVTSAANVKIETQQKELYSKWGNQVLYTQPEADGYFHICPPILDLAGQTIQIILTAEVESNTQITVDPALSGKITSAVVDTTNKKIINVTFDNSVTEADFSSWKTDDIVIDLGDGVTYTVSFYASAAYEITVGDNGRLSIIDERTSPAPVADVVYADTSQYVVRELTDTHITLIPDAGYVIDTFNLTDASNNITVIQSISDENVYDLTNVESRTYQVDVTFKRDPNVVINEKVDKLVEDLQNILKDIKTADGKQLLELNYNKEDGEVGFVFDADALLGGGLSIDEGSLEGLATAIGDYLQANFPDSTVKVDGEDVYVNGAFKGAGLKKVLFGSTGIISDFLSNLAGMTPNDGIYTFMDGLEVVLEDGGADLDFDMAIQLKGDNVAQIVDLADKLGDYLDIELVTVAGSDYTQYANGETEVVVMKVTMPNTLMDTVRDMAEDEFGGPVSDLQGYFDTLKVSTCLNLVAELDLTKIVPSEYVSEFDSIFGLLNGNAALINKVLDKVDISIMNPNGSTFIDAIRDDGVFVPPYDELAGASEWTVFINGFIDLLNMESGTAVFEVPTGDYYDAAIGNYIVPVKISVDLQAALGFAATETIIVELVIPFN